MKHFMLVISIDLWVRHYRWSLLDERGSFRSIISDYIIGAAKKKALCNLAGESGIYPKNGVYVGLFPWDSSLWNLIQKPKEFSEIEY